MKSGAIMLVSEYEEIVDYKRYKSNAERIKHIEAWKKMYAKGFNKCYLQFAPDVNIELVNEDGTDKKDGHKSNGQNNTDNGNRRNYCGVPAYRLARWNKTGFEDEG